MKVKSNKGFTGVDIAVSTVILIIFISLITTMFYNLSVTAKKIERKTTATSLAIQTIEAMKIIDFDNLTETITINEINNLIENKIDIPNGYNIEVGVDNAKYPDVIKIISAEVNYKSGKNDENVKIETLVKNEIQTIIPKGIYASINGNTLSFFDNEEAARANADSDSHYYGNIEGKGYGVTFDDSQVKWNINIPWYKDVSLIKTASIVDEIYPTNTSGWFYDCSSLTQIQNIANLHTNNDTSMAGMFRNCSSLTSLDVTDFNTSNVTTMISMFQNCVELTNLNVRNFDTGKVTSMRFMFGSCQNIENIDVSQFNTSKVTNMKGMFDDCSKLSTINVSNFDTSNVTNMGAMFRRLTNVKNIDLSTFDTSKVEDMEDMFGSSLLVSIDMTGWNTSNVKTMRHMFAQCTQLSSLNINHFNVNKVTDFNNMFYSCRSLQALDLSNWNTSNGTDMIAMFGDCSKLTKIYVGTGWKTTQANTTDMFTYCGTSSVTYK